MSDSPQGEIPTVGSRTADLPPEHRLAHLAIGERPGDSIGPYRLLSVLGEGGFGVVFLAERREPFVQRVALKIIKPGMDSRAVLARFEQERQALAVMDHPNIAKVLDGGVTPSGRPYFVLEHVAGEPITDYCDRHRLTVRQRLELFIPVCEAVQHAHMKGIIHRDLKPSNILVSAKDGQAIPKVIDFGVAKAISHTLTEKTVFTEQGVLIGTPEYMSPEQAEMGATDIDTRSDIYSLGAVLYELLTGALPFDPQELRRAAFGRIQQIIRETDPPRPSTRLTSMGADAAGVAKRRQMRVDELTRALRNELDWVALKALNKDRVQRYQTASELGADVAAYMAGLPIAAGPRSFWYYAAKHARRHRPIFAAMSLGLLASLAGVALAVRYGIRAELAMRAHRSALVETSMLRDMADAEFTDARARVRIVPDERIGLTQSVIDGLRIPVLIPYGAADPIATGNIRGALPYEKHLEMEWGRIAPHEVPFSIRMHLPRALVSWAVSAGWVGVLSTMPSSRGSADGFIELRLRYCVYSGIEVGGGLTVAAQAIEDAATRAGFSIGEPMRAEALDRLEQEASRLAGQPLVLSLTDFDAGLSQGHQAVPAMVRIAPAETSDR